MWSRAADSSSSRNTEKIPAACTKVKSLNKGCSGLARRRNGRHCKIINRYQTNHLFFCFGLGDLPKAWNLKRMEVGELDVRIDC